jgi:hypothetical protein
MSKTVYRGVEYDDQKYLEYQQQMMQKLNFLQLIKEQKQKEYKRHQASIATLIASK